jgi:hypothetical protein
MNSVIKEFASGNKSLCVLEDELEAYTRQQLLHYNINYLKAKESNCTTYVSRITSYNDIEECLMNVCTPYAYYKMANELKLIYQYKFAQRNDAVGSYEISVKDIETVKANKIQQVDVEADLDYYQWNSWGTMIRSVQISGTNKYTENVTISCSCGTPNSLLHLCRHCFFIIFHLASSGDIILNDSFFEKIIGRRWLKEHMHSDKYRLTVNTDNNLVQECRNSEYRDYNNITIIIII